MNIIQLHWHSGHISGVGFLKVPKNFGKHTQKKKKKKIIMDGSNLIDSWIKNVFISSKF